MGPRIVIVDYGMGNLRSVQKAFERVGVRADYAARAEQLLNADAVVLPGVGAFADAMDELRGRGLVEPLRAYLASGRPFLGICLGLHLLFERSFEGGEHEGLGYLEGDVRRFPPEVGKVPHMGWNQVWRGGAEDELFAGVANGEWFYFVHSYYVVPKDRSIVAGETEYGIRFCSMVRRGHLLATQFHPEKSQQAGLRLLANFVRRVAAVPKRSAAERERQL